MYLQSKEEDFFNEFINLSTAEYRVADIFQEISELTRRSLMQEILPFTDGLQQFQQSSISLSDQNYSDALFEEFLTKNLTDMSACPQFSNLSVHFYCFLRVLCDLCCAVNHNYFVQTLFSKSLITSIFVLISTQFIISKQ